MYIDSNRTTKGEYIVTHHITLLPGDGIGPEVMTATVQVLKATGVSFNFDIHSFGESTGGKLPQSVINSIEANRVALKGPTATPTGEGHRSLNVQLRERFELYANVRPVHTVPGVRTRFSDTPVDLVIFRENLEDLYVGRETVFEGGASALAVITREHSERIARYAFEYAKQHGRRKVTVVHKANILKETHGLFLRTAQVVAKEYPSIECNDFIADNCFMQLVTRPERFDCLLLPNFLGDLASDICAGLVGGLGFAPGANIGNEYAIFEAVHGTAPDIAGKGIANPTSLILSAAMLLDHLGEVEAAARVRVAVYGVLEEGVTVTADVNPAAASSTWQFAEAVASRVASMV